jgi:large conductance mechanosensitive channel
VLEGFKKFISRGNVVDLAVGVIIGGLFTGIVNALVADIINPLIAALFGKPNFDNVLQFTIHGSDIRIGVVITAVVNFLLTAAAVYYLIVVPINKFNERRSTGSAAAEKPEDVQLLTEIRDLIKAGQ